MSPATRAVFEARIQEKREQYVALMLRARRLDKMAPEVPHLDAYEEALAAWKEYTGIEYFVDRHTGNFTRRLSVRIPETEGE